MSEPPPTPLATTASSPENERTSKSPCLPAAGSQNAERIACGVRGKEPGGHGCPRSRTSTERPASPSRQAATDPPNPEPTTTTSKRSTRPFSPTLDLPGDGAPGVGLVAAER